MNSSNITRTMLGAAALFALSAPAANAATLAADYLSAATAEGDEDLIAAFDTYITGEGANVILQTGGSVDGILDAGDTFTSYYQARIVAHELAAGTLPTGGLNDTYELTVVATYTETVLSGGSSPDFSIDGGAFTIFFDTTPDSDLAADSGFDDGEVLLSGPILGGGGSILAAFGIGVAQVDVDVDTSSPVYAPGVAAASGTFTLEVDSTGLASAGVTSVQGFAPAGAGDLLVGAVGSYSLTPVPVPPAVWLFGSALAMLGLRRR